MVVLRTQTEMEFLIIWTVTAKKTKAPKRGFFDALIFAKDPVINQI